ncbi:uncharacterized protein Z519_08605 [Cladophialophora bantiana CBS 173.52]|uniref:Xylanolytic transcriptional activator regulatory domain-containing protein n=1 Tax=Cladophialophora bantiana (strain ATCC 10958 / CBS 173.52 / CDC B-1940 / NIH 8579) TaxID=1442370 RepID=A0A0D2FWB4_CLAB1|nr:uncharacterized protein Z519_08605 [Cladophialophora bantiana CBS 173.52]KIW90822.1 hypothetical protein Z519_08605 [Cladophialophora bantiana CBS 173.52]
MLDQPQPEHCHDGFESPDGSAAADIILSQPGVDMSTFLSSTTNDRKNHDSYCAELLEFHAPVAPSPRNLAADEARLGGIGTAILPRHEENVLVSLYFRHVHHLCPVIDESDFAIRYTLHQQGDLSARIEMIQLQAMMFTAIAHATEFQLRQMPFSTVLEGQTALLENVKHLYNHDHSVSHVTRTTVCLLLSFWSPYNSDACVNSFWLDRAFFHAREARLWDPLSDSATPPSRRKVIWWCCLVRDRIIGMGLRRPHRLHTTAHERTWPMVSMADFGSEVICSQYMDRRSKQLRMSSFIWLCHLSIQIVSIIEFQREAMFSRTWRTGRENVSSVTKRIETVLDINHRLDVLELQFELDGNLTLRGGDPQVDVVAVKTLQVMIQSVNPPLIVVRGH